MERFHLNSMCSLSKKKNHKLKWKIDYLNQTIRLCKLFKIQLINENARKTTDSLSR